MDGMQIEAMENRYLEPHEFQKPVTHCEYCGAALYEGDSYYNVNGDVVCDDCVDYMRRTVHKEDFE